MTDAERHAALEAVAAEVRGCTRCRLHETRTNAVPGEGDPDTEVVFVGEGPGLNEDREGRPFVGRAGGLLVQLLRSIGWSREQVFITNIVKCRPPDNRDPLPDEIGACQPYLQRQLAALDPALVVTLGRHSMGTFMPGARITSAHGTVRSADPATGARQALVFPMFHPAAALRSKDVERLSYEDAARIPDTLLRARARRDGWAAEAQRPAAAPEPHHAARDIEKPEPAFAVVASAPGVQAVVSLAVDEVPPEPDWLSEVPPLEPWADQSEPRTADIAAIGDPHADPERPAVADPERPAVATSDAATPETTSWRTPPTAAPGAFLPETSPAPDADQLTLF